MIYADFECPSGHITEHIVHWKQKKVRCSTCGKKAKRIISAGRQYLGNQDCEHVRSAVDALLDKDDHSPSATTLRQHPTRENLNRFMKERGLSRMDYTEHGGPPIYHKPPEVDMSRVHEEVARRHFERKRIEVGG
jgi:hypothetical protein